MTINDSRIPVLARQLFELMTQTEPPGQQGLEEALQDLVSRGLLTVGPGTDGLEELTEFIMEHVPGEPSRSQGAVRTALRLLQRHYGPSSPATEAQALWKELNLHDNDQVTDAVLVAKIADFKRGGVAVSMSVTDGVDWVTQLGMLHAGLGIMNQNSYDPRPAEDDE